MPIPEADLAAKCELIKKGQAHRKFRRDPADNPPQTARQDKPPHKHHRFTATRRAPHPRKRTSAEPASMPQEDTRMVEHHPRSPSDRRVASCTTGLGTAWYAPTTTTTGTGIATDMGRVEPPFLGESLVWLRQPRVHVQKACQRLDFHWPRICHRQWKMTT